MQLVLNKNYQQVKIILKKTFMIFYVMIFNSKWRPSWVSCLSIFYSYVNVRFHNTNHMCSGAFSYQQLSWHTKSRRNDKVSLHQSHLTCITIIIQTGGISCQTISTLHHVSWCYPVCYNINGLSYYPWGTPTCMPFVWWLLFCQSNG